MKFSLCALALSAFLTSAAYAQSGGPITTERLTITGPGSTGDVSGMSVLRAGGSRARTISDRAADTLNPLDFVAAGADVAAIQSGLADAALAFNAAIASRPAGTEVRLVVPAGTYRLISADVTNAGRLVTVDLLSGAKVGIDHGVAGVATDKRLYVNRVEQKVGERLRVNAQGAGQSNTVVAIGNQTTVVNTGEGNATFGETFDYVNIGTSMPNAGGGDIGRYQVARWPNMSAPGLAGSWEVAVSPTFTAADVAAGKYFAMGTREIHAINNSPDTGFSEFDSRSSVPGVGTPSTFTGAYLIVPDVWRPSGGIGGHINYGLALLGSRENNNRSPSYSPKIYAPLLIGGDSIAPDGRGVFVGGATGGPISDRPRTPLAAKYAFARGIDLTEATFDDGRALALAPGHKATWGAGGTAASVTADSAGKVTITAPGGLVRPSDAWTSYTPTVTPYSGAVSGVTTSGSYRYVASEKIVHFTAKITATNSTSMPGFAISLPMATGPADFTFNGMDRSTGVQLIGYVGGGGGTMILQVFDSRAFAPQEHTLVVSGFYQVP